MDFWNTLGSRCTNAAGSLGNNDLFSDFFNTQRTFEALKMARKALKDKCRSYPNENFPACETDAGSSECFVSF